MKIENVFFDFGGTIDAPGLHPRKVFWDAFLKANLFAGSDRDDFQKAYSLADQKMLADGSAKNLNLGEFNRYNCELILDFLGKDRSLSETPATAITDEMTVYIRGTVPVISALGKTLPLGLISNFTGNLAVILREFQMRDLFQTVTESFYVGCAKPDEEIFKNALRAAKAHPKNSVYVGDNEKNDIIPAKKLGFHTVLIRPKNVQDPTAADLVIQDLRDLAEFIQSK